MKKIILTSAIILLLLSSMSYAKKKDEGLKGFPIEGFPLYIYKDFASTDNNFIPSGWMGDYGDINYLDSFQKNPKDGNSCIKIEYSNKRSNNAGWAGIYWQAKENNWGTEPVGFKLTGGKRLYIHARGENGGEVIEFKMGGITGKYPDSTWGATGMVLLTKNWQRFEIALDDLDLSFINGGFCVVFAGNYNAKGCTFYIDEVYYTDKIEREGAGGSKKKKKKK